MAEIIKKEIISRNQKALIYSDNNHALLNTINQDMTLQKTPITDSRKEEWATLFMTP